MRLSRYNVSLLFKCHKCQASPLQSVLSHPDVSEGGWGKGGREVSGWVGGGLILGGGAVCSRYDRGPHMQQWDSTGGTHYQPHRHWREKGSSRGGVDLCVCAVNVCVRM